MLKKRLLIYGCNGYTGKLIAERANSLGLNPILSGRNEEGVKKIASALNLEYRIFDLESEGFFQLFNEVKVVLNCAGPFQNTAPKMVHACLETGTHYLDITGEIQVFEYLKTLHEEAVLKNILILPGVGFDVVPSDCLALHLKEKMPDATHLELALMTVGGMLSHGTSITVIENLGEGSSIRKNGKIVKTKSGSYTREIDFGFCKKTGVEIPWGDVSTAFTSTQIPNIRVYNILPKSLIKKMGYSNYLKFILKRRFVKNYLIKKVKLKPAGPNEVMRNEAKTFIWGEVANAKNEKLRALLEMPEGYKLTAETAVDIAKMFISNECSAIGYQTPAQCFGANYITRFFNIKFKMLN